MNLLREVGRGLLDLVYPPICAACGSLVDAEAAAFCGSCRKTLTSDSYPSCLRCAGTIGPFSATEGGCLRCRDAPYHFERAVRLGPYDGLLRDIILRMKHASGEVLAHRMGELWAEHDARRLRELAADLIIPIPLHWRRRWARGYNQSEALARAVSSSLQVPCRPAWLRRVRPTPQQTQQTPSGRWTNVRGAFRCRRYADVRGKQVLLIDDVLTTGSTCSEAARALRDAGVARVVVAVLAHSHR